MRLRLDRSTVPVFFLATVAVGGCSDGGTNGGSGGSGTVTAGAGGQIPSVGGGGGATAGSSGTAIAGSNSGAGSSGAPTAGSGGVATAGSAGTQATAGSGGTATGGAGGTATGGAGASAGGSAGAGGATTGKWGTVEDPGVACTVGPMPSVGSLAANNKLPDAFKKMDGTAMTSKNEWLCRREEILQQGWEFIYGKKPRTPKESVSGTVGNTDITVTVDGKGTFSARVSLPSSGTKPYPAVIGFGGVTGMPVPAGVATINFDAYSVGAEVGGKSPGKGAFYTVHGADHEAGLLTAWAWGISRIIDVIEKNPGTIDPTKLAVTGCSRFGKGAFVAGVMDNRIALTIPVESGVGGTPALRLIELLDAYSGSEFPYHAMSYEQWFSPEKLGQFTNGNSAAADNTNKLPVDMHQMMALIAPRGLYIVDNPSTMYNGLDRNSAYATALVGKMIFAALGVGDHITYQGNSGSHCAWRSHYTAPLTANIQKFLLGDDRAQTGSFATDLGGTRPTAEAHIDWTPPTLSGEL
ncbi:MAG TPA: PE PGRS family protein [Polyangiaceae bacterium]